jgi:hypothetical protein
VGELHMFTEAKENNTVSFFLRRNSILLIFL